jgi:flagellar hook-basal body complex protein FliE
MVNTIDAQAVLTQMRSLATQARGVEVAPSTPAVGAGDFREAMTKAIDFVNTHQQEAGKLAERFERGDAGVDISSVMVAIQKANISFQAATQVRNRLVSAYQDIMNMPL